MYLVVFNAYSSLFYEVTDSSLLLSRTRLLIVDGFFCVS